MNTHFVLAGGRIHCAQCQAKSKRTQQQCRAPAMRGKKVYKFHGGLSTGPKTAEAMAACAAAKTVPGTETRAIRAEQKKKFAELRLLAQRLGIRRR